MTDDRLIERAIVLIQQQKFDEAGKVLSSILSQDPNHTFALELMCEVKIHNDDYKNAEQLINTAISLTPDDSRLHYTKARVHVGQEQYSLAEESLQESITLDPYNASAFALWASIKLNKKQFQEALNLANHALEIEPDNLAALNMRSTALIKLDKAEESFETIEGALNEDPNNAYTHANYGWNLLEKGDHKKALTHFTEALRNDPNMEYAQSGMAEALKARYAIYRWFLKYAFWIGNLTAKYQWAYIVIFFVGFRVLKGLSSSNPALSPYLVPLIVLLYLFAFSTWVITPIGNLFLRLNKYGKHLLNKKEILSSNFVAMSILVFLAGGISYLILGDDAWLTIAAFGFSMMIPLSVMFAPSKNKYTLAAYTVGMAAIGTIAIYQTFATGELFNTFSGIFLFSLFIFQWVANAMLIKQNNI